MAVHFVSLDLLDPYSPFLVRDSAISRVQTNNGYCRSRWLNRNQHGGLVRNAVCLLKRMGLCAAFGLRSLDARDVPTIRPVDACNRLDIGPALRPYKSTPAPHKQQQTHVFQFAKAPHRILVELLQDVIITGETRWDEKAGLRRDAVRSQVIDVLEAQEIKETG